MATRFDKPLLDLLRKYDKKSILHCHGQIKEVLPEIALMNPDGLHPVEPPPKGNCTLTEARRELGQDIVLIGNIQYTDLDEKEPQEIEHLVAEAIEQGGPERFILSPSCTPYEEEISSRLSNNYITMIKAGLKYGQIGK